MAGTPLITIVTIAFNAERYIAATARSVVAQTYPNIEYILVDGGSTDRTIERFHEVTHNRARVYSEKDDGIYDAMNKGAALATGEYVLFLHADDEFIDNDAVKSLLNALQQSGKKWVCAFYKMRNSRDEILKEDVIRDFDFADMMRADQIRHQTALLPVEFVRKCPFAKKYKYAMDYAHFLRVWDQFGPPGILHRHISYFRWDGNNLSSNFEESLLDEYRVKIDFRRERGQHLAIIKDTAFYLLRRLKIALYYNRRFGPDRRS